MADVNKLSGFGRLPNGERLFAGGRVPAATLEELNADTPTAALKVFSGGGALRGLNRFGEGVGDGHFDFHLRWG